MRRFFSIRLIILVASILILLLLVGSASLQRVGYKAAQATSSAILVVENPNVKPDLHFDAVLNSTLAQSALVAGGQFAINYDPTVASFVSLQPASGWKTAKLKVTDGSISWAAVPQDSLNPLAQLSGTTSWATITFQAVKEGDSALALSQKETIITAIDANQPSGIYNAVTTVQSAQVKVSDTAPSPVPIDTPSTVSNTPDQLASHLRATDVLSFATSALVFVSLPQPANVSVSFGETKPLSSHIQSVQPSTTQTLLLTGLKKNTRYYYQLLISDDQSANKVTTQLQSFLTTDNSAGELSADKSEVVTFPPVSHDQSTVYIKLSDQSGNVITNVTPDLKLTQGNAVIGSISQNQGIYQATITSPVSAKQVVHFDVLAAGTSISSQSVTFDPNYNNNLTSAAAENSQLAFDTPVKITLAALLIGMVLLLVVFFRLARVR